MQVWWWLLLSCSSRPDSYPYPLALILANEELCSRVTPGAKQKQQQQKMFERSFCSAGEGIRFFGFDTIRYDKPLIPPPSNAPRRSISCGAPSTVPILGIIFLSANINGMVGGDHRVVISA
uniref:Putative secreted protein n=1 Tax=Anopheles marajoara TaxID=58244 RepID=A0A2M4C7B6_9DIPT